MAAARLQHLTLDATVAAFAGAHRRAGGVCCARAVVATDDAGATIRRPEARAIALALAWQPCTHVHGTTVSTLLHTGNALVGEPHARAPLRQWPLSLQSLVTAHASSTKQGSLQAHTPANTPTALVRACQDKHGVVAAYPFHNRTRRSRNIVSTG